MIDIDKAHSVDNGYIVDEENNGPFITGGALSPVGQDLPRGQTFYIQSISDNRTVIWQRFGAGVNDWRSYPAQDVSFDDAITALGSSDVQGAIESVKSILDALPDSMPAVQGRFLVGGSIIPNSWASYPLNTTDVETQSSVLDINPGDTTQVRLKEAGAYLCGYTFTAFESNNPNSAQARVLANGSTTVGGSETNNEGEAGNGGSSLELNFHFARTFIYQANANDYLELQAQAPGETYSLTTPVTFWCVKLDAQFANFQISSGGSSSRADLLGGGVSELIQNTNQTMTGTARTIINWGAQDLFDASCFTHSLGSSEITLDKAGSYRVSYTVNIQRTANGRVQGNALWQSAASSGGFSDIDKSYSHCYTRSSDASNFGSCTSTFTYQAAIGDRLRAAVFGNEGPAGANILGDRTNVVIEFIGE